MGLQKSEEELEFSPMVMRPERHVVSGHRFGKTAALERAAGIVEGALVKQNDLYFVASNDLSVDDISLINFMLHVQCDLVYEHPVMFIYKARFDILSDVQCMFLDDLKQKLKWFSWRVI